MRFAWAVLLLLGLLLPGPAAAEKPLRIVTSFLPAYCLAANVAGKAAQVENLFPGAVNLHDYQLNPADIRKLANADIIVINGLGLETFLDKAIANAGPNTAQKILRLSDGLEQELIRDHRSETTNPHIWLDPVLASRSVTNLARVLAAKDPINALAYRTNAIALCARLARLDEEIQKALEPVRNVPFITFHNAFPYFVRRYTLNLAGVVEEIPEVSPSPREMSRLLQEIRRRKVRALFTEPGASPRLAQQIAHDTGLRLAELDPLETGVLAPQSYEQGMRRNLVNLKTALHQ